MRKLKIKVCGMTKPDNIADLAGLEIDYMGFIFYKQSSRYASELSCDDIPNIKKVGVFVNESKSVMSDMIAMYGLNCVQLHGEESPEVCKWIKGRGVEVFKAVNIGPDFDFDSLEPYKGVVNYFIFDAKGPKRGGNGIPFDWTKLAEYTGDIPFFLSGGIDPGMVNEIKDVKHPKLYGLDINSRFEVRPGVKNIKHIEKFLGEIKGTEN